MTWRGGLTTLLLASWALIGCEALQGDVPCASDTDCKQGGYVCDLEIGLCRPSEEVSRTDAAGVDAQASDGSLADLGAADHAQQDAPMPDSSTSDSALSDSSPDDRLASDLTRPDTIAAQDVIDSDDGGIPGPICSEASPHYLEDAGFCFECFRDSHCNDDNPCTTDTCKSNNTCEILAVAGRLCGAVMDAGTCTDGGYCGVCDPEGLCRIRCQSDGECGGRTCDIDAGLCPPGITP